MYFFFFLSIFLKSTYSDLELYIMTTVLTAWKVSKYRVFSGPYSVRLRENMDQKKLRIWTHFTQCTVCLLLSFLITVLKLNFYETASKKNFSSLFVLDCFINSAAIVSIVITAVIITIRSSYIKRAENLKNNPKNTERKIITFFVITS